MSCNGTERSSENAGKYSIRMKRDASSKAYHIILPDRPLSMIRIRARPGNSRQGWLTAGGMTFPVALGRGGILANKREGDGGTPRGIFRPRKLWWRADRHRRPQTHLAVRKIRPEDAWCEDPRDRHYNQPIRRIRERAGDRLTRKDHLTTSSSRSITTPRRALPAAAAPCSCTWRGRISDRPPDASR